MAIVVQFSFYKEKIDILRNCKELKRTKISIFEDFSQETYSKIFPKRQCKFVKENGRRYYLKKTR